MLIFTLKKEWYEKIRRGEKTVEYREVKPYWTKRLKNEFRDMERWGINFFYRNKPGDSLRCHSAEHICVLRNGYTQNKMVAKIEMVAVVNGKDTDLAIDAPVYAIHLADVREMVLCPHCKGNGAMLGDGLGVMECPWCGCDGEWEAGNEQTD